MNSTTPDLINPYIAGNPVTGPEMFFGRQDVFDFVRDHLAGKYRDNVIVLYGQRRTGKTSVLYQMSRHLEDRYLCIFLDLHGMALDGLSGFLWELASQIVRALRREYRFDRADLPRPDQASFREHPRHHLEHEFLPRIWSAIGDRHLLLMIDEAARLEEQVRAGRMEAEVFQYLRHLMQHFERLSFLFSLGSGVEEMAEEYAFLFNVALCKKISFLERDAAIALITKPVAGYYEVTLEARERILQLTSGHPYHTQLLCHSLFARWQQRRMSEATAGDVDALLDEVVEHGSPVLKHVWEESTPAEKAVMAAMVTAMGDTVRPIGTRDLTGAWITHEMAVPVREQVRAVQSLIARDVIRGDDSYNFTVDLQRLWVRRHRRLEWVREEIADALQKWSVEFTDMPERAEGRTQDERIRGWWARFTWKRSAAVVGLLAALLGVGLALNHGEVLLSAAPTATATRHPTARPTAAPTRVRASPVPMESATGSGPGQFHGPADVAVDSDGIVYVVDQGNNRVQIFSSNGIPLRSFGSEGHAGDQFENPTSIAIAPDGTIYVADFGNRRIAVYRYGVSLDPIQKHKRHDPHLRAFAGLTVDRDGDIFASDLYHGQVLKLSPRGHWRGQWGQKGQLPGRFHHPESVAVDPQGAVYVVDTYNNRVQKFALQGKPPSATVLLTIGRRGAAPGEFDRPQGMAVDRWGNVYVADTDNNRVQKFSSSGRLLGVIGRYGRGKGQMIRPAAVAVDLGGNLYVADYSNNRIEKFSPSGRPIWATHGNRTIWW